MLLMFSLSTDIPRITWFPILYCFKIFLSSHSGDCLIPRCPSCFDYFFLCHTGLGKCKKRSVFSFVICALCPSQWIIHLLHYTLWHAVYVLAHAEHKSHAFVYRWGREIFVNTFLEAAYCTTVKMSNNHELYYMLCGLIFFRRVFLSLGICDAERWLLK